MNNLKNITAIINGKGGVGKTSTSKCLAMSKADNNKKVLVIDVDSQSSISSQFLEEYDKTIYDVLVTGVDINDVVYKTNYENVDLIPANLKLQSAHDLIVSSGVTTGENIALRLKTAISKIDKQYDKIIIDCPPTMDLMVTMALSSANDIVIPMTCDKYSLDGITMVLDKVNKIKINNNINLKIAGVFLNKVEINTNIHKEFIKSMYEILPDYFTETYIKKSVAISENTFATTNNKLKKSVAYKQYLELFNELGV